MAKLKGQLFARLALDYFDHPKIACLSPEAVVAHLEMLVYSRKYLTDGVIPMRIAMRYAVHVVDELQNNDPENPSVTKRQDGSLILHGYSDFQETREEVERRRRSRQEAAEARWSKDAKSNASSNARSKARRNAETETETETDSKEQANQDSRAKKPQPSDAEKHINDVAGAAYEAIGKSANYLALRGIAKWCVNDRGLGSEQFTAAVVAVYQRGKPITKQTIGQQLDGHLDHRQNKARDRFDDHRGVVAELAVMDYENGRLEIL